MKNLTLKSIITGAVVVFVAVVLAGCPTTPQELTVADVVGMTQSAAESAITGTGLIVGEVSTQYSDSVDEGMVISQNPRAGMNVSPGTAVDLVISLGPGAGEGEGEGEAAADCDDMAPCTHGGLGTTEDPYIICTIEELQAIGDNETSRSAHYRLGRDIDATVTADWNSGAGFVPIGSWDTGTWEAVPFTGSFDGAGHAICNLYINASGTFFSVGLFGAVGEDAAIRNLGMKNCSVTGTASGEEGSDVLAGGLVGIIADGGTVTNCYAMGHVTGTASWGGVAAGGLVGINLGMVTDCYETGDVSATGTAPGDSLTVSSGGLVGYNGGAVTNCYATGGVTATGTNRDDSVYVSAGGLVGVSSDGGGTVMDCYATGNVLATITTTGTDTGEYNRVGAGGLVGESWMPLTNCYATGDVSATGVDGDVHAGGLGGLNRVGTVTNCYATGDVSATGTGEDYASAGGLVGDNEDTVSNCYATGNVSGTGTSSEVYVGGLVGDNHVGEEYGEGATTACFWDVTTSGTEISAGGDGAVGLDTSEMMAQDAFVDAGWDFAEVWNVAPGETYPWLRALDYSEVGYPAR